MRSVVFDPAIRSVNNELASLFRFEAFPRSLDRLVLSDENLSGFAFPFYDPGAVRRKYRNGLCGHVGITPFRLTARLTGQTQLIAASPCSSGVSREWEDKGPNGAGQQQFLVGSFYPTRSRAAGGEPVPLFLVRPSVEQP